MKKRLAALAMCLVFTGSLIAVPKARASMVGAGAAAVGAAVLATYMAASGLTINTDSAETVVTGLDSLAEDYLTDTGSTETADSWLSTIAGLVTIPGAGVLQLPASVVRIVGAFTDWLTETFGLTEAGSEGVVVPGVAESYKYGSYTLSNINEIWVDRVNFPYGIIARNPNSGVFTLVVSADPFTVLSFSAGAAGGRFKYTVNSLQATCSSDGMTWSDLKVVPYGASLGSRPIWGSHDLYMDDGTLALAASEPVPVGVVAGQVGLTRGENYTDIASEANDRPVTIFVPQSIVAPDDLATVIPDQIVSGTLAPTYELTQEGTGEGTDTEDGTGADDTTVGLLQSILQGIKAIPDAFTNSLTDVFTPSQEAVDSLAAEVDAKLPLIPTLQNFGGDLVDKLQHPEQCANGLGLTTVVDLEKGRGTYLGNTQHDIFNVSWYLEYKPLVDDIIVGFCWLCFLWNCYGALPRIIHGEGTVDKVATILQQKFDGDGD